MEETNRICPWCSTPIPTSADACPKCGALVEGAVAKDLPGTTVADAMAVLGLPDEGRTPDDLDPRAWLLAGRGKRNPYDDKALDPPSEAVLLEMRKMELEAQIENAGTEVMNPTGDESLDANAPSEEAIEAFEAGLLDKTGPAGETDLDSLAAPWEDPKLENRFHPWQSPDTDKPDTDDK
ncbi:MAG: zinc ribbon domain-containing protein [Candidatus Limnocylindrales bacterium]